MAPFRSAFVAAAILTRVSSGYSISVSASGGNATSPHQYGIMHEDINNSGDGGIYAELIMNRAFQGSSQYPSSLNAWAPVNGAALALQNLSTPLSSALPTSMNVAWPSGAGQVGFSNTGYWGIDVKVQKYTGSFWVMGAYGGSFTASLQSALTNETFGSVAVPSQSRAGAWTEHTFELVPHAAAPNSNNTFAITFDVGGSVSGGSSLDFNLISLFPPTYNNRPNGMRIDLMEALAGLKPTFFRLPGGNMLEGNSNRSWWMWNDTIGPLKDRPGYAGTWGYEQTNGLGLVEYMLWAQDLGCEPVLAVWDGLALDGDVTPAGAMAPLVQAALDELEFLMGDAATTPYGALRASLGYPEPWAIRYVEVGNEDWLAGAPLGWDTYRQYRFNDFLTAINAKYPDIQVIASGSVFDGFAIPAPGAGDYHTYQQPDVFVSSFGMLDQLTARNQTLIGEMAAVHPNGGTDWSAGLMPFPWWIGSVGEAVFLIAAERNSDKIIGTTYAPSMRNMNRWQWAVTLLQHAADPALTTPSTSYHVWQLFGAHTITHTLPATSSDRLGPLYWVAGVNNATGSHILKAAVYNSSAESPVPVSVSFEGVPPGTRARLTLLAGPAGDPYAYNDPFTRVDVVGRTETVVTAGGDGAFVFAMPELSVAVLETGGGDCQKKTKRKEERPGGGGGGGWADRWRVRYIQSNE